MGFEWIPAPRYANLLFQGTSISLPSLLNWAFALFPILISLLLIYLFKIKQNLIFSYIAVLNLILLINTLPWHPLLTRFSYGYFFYLIPGVFSK